MEAENVLGLMPQTTPPRIPGSDFAGVVAAGPDERIGTEVWGTGGDLGFTRDGTHAESVVMAPGFEARALKPPRIAVRYPLEDGVRVYERVEEDVSGKVLLFPLRKR
jgi:NADPH:quinone reductase-like Zn-dependent oxidoreductase